MPSPLIRNMIEQYGYPELDIDSIDDYLQSHNEVVLFFTENPKQFPESNDVAMILPELMKVFHSRLNAAVICQSAQRELQSRYGFTSWPALVFLRRGDYLGAITRVQNWDDYLSEISCILESEARRTPAFPLPVESAASGCGN